MRAVTPLRPALVAALACLTLVGCSSDPADNAAPGAPAGSSAAPVAPPAVPDASGEDDPIPAPRAGPLTEQSLPQAAELGRGWTPFADPGSHDSGFRGNGTWVRQRDPRDVAEGLRPVGCDNDLPAQPVPAPQHALEGTYRGPDKASAVSLLLAYPSPAQASTALRILRGYVRTCGKGGSEALGIRVLRDTSSLLADTREDPFTPEAVTTEVIVAEGSRLLLLAVNADDAVPVKPLEKAARAAATR